MARVGSTRGIGSNPRNVQEIQNGDWTGDDMIDFQVDWREAPGVRDPILAGSWCALTIRIDGQVVTRVYDKRTHGWRDAVYGSAFPLCAWIVDNLWFLLYEPYRWASPYGSRDLARNPADRPWVHRHSLLAAREGGALPDLTLCRDGDAILVRWLQDGGDNSHPFLRFAVRDGYARLDPGAVRRSLAGFVETVLARVADREEPEVAKVRDDWHDLQTLAPGERDLCIWSARLGINAHYQDELSEEDARRLETTIGQLGPLLAGDLLDAASIGTLEQDIEWMEEAHNHAHRMRRSRATRLGSSTGNGARPSQRASATAYAVGYDRARTLRAQSGIQQGVLPDMHAVAHRLGWADTPEVRTETRPGSPIHAVVDYGRGDVPYMAFHAASTPPGQRFLLARSLYIEACTDAAERRLVTDSHTWNQRASRAFAAELLAPAETLRQWIGGSIVSDRDIASFADEFVVDAELIERQIENHRLAEVGRTRASQRQW